MNRGAGQGDALGSYQAAATQAHSRAAWANESSGARMKGACDEWYIDDGQLVIRPMLLDQWLRAFDSAISSYGATRRTIADGNAKSSRRLYCPSDQLQTIQGWCTEYVSSTMRVLTIDEETAALGAPFGGADVLDTVVGQVLKKICDKRLAITSIGHAATEMVLTRRCAAVA